MKAICGVNCNECDFFKTKKCIGCTETKGCPFGKKCWIAKYIEIGGMENYLKLKDDLIKEFNSLKIIGMPKVLDLFPLNGEVVNLEYQLASMSKIKLLNDDEIYLGNQLECEFNDDDIKKCFGLIASMNFIIVCEYFENELNPEIIIYKRR